MTWAVLSPPKKHKRRIEVAGVVLSYPFKLSGFLVLMERSFNLKGLGLVRVLSWVIGAHPNS